MDVQGIATGEMDGADSVRVWVRNEHDEWVKGKLCDKADSDTTNSDDLSVEVVLTDGNKVKVERSSLHLCNENENEKGVDEMSNLNHLHEPAILENLKKRFMHDTPYTYADSICIALNPFQRIDNLYDQANQVLYSTFPRGTDIDPTATEENVRKQLLQLKPHVYATSSAAYHNLHFSTQHQSILVSGESGAGKTETTKILMDHLASLSGSQNREQSSSLVEKVLMINPLLEAFGNATTVRNDNSSRFGKLISMQFCDKRLSGAHITHYLLEKSRLIHQSTKERNFHIFYQLLLSQSFESHKSALLLDDKTPFDFKYLNNMNSVETIDGLTDDQFGARTMQALTSLEMDPAELQNVLQILATILHLGNVQLRSSEDGEGSTADSCEALDSAAQLLGLDSEVLSVMLCFRTVTANGESYQVPNKVAAAESTKHSVAKRLYSGLFDWLVTRINSTISNADQNNKTISLLDIFGFENFDSNSFEQLCINYTNEKLQQKFVKDVLREVQQGYLQEGIQWRGVHFEDNRSVLHLIENNIGVLQLLNDECLRPQGNHTNYVSKLLKLQGDNRRLSGSRLDKSVFTIEHYAEAVSYSADAFLLKNLDRTTPDVTDVLRQSSNLLVASVQPAIARRSSISSQLMKQLKELMEMIESTNVHFIKCIKPNQLKSPTEFDAGLVSKQLRCSGIIEALRISTSGYANKLDHQLVRDRFQPLAARETSLPALVRRLLGAGSPQYAVGHTKVFFAKGVLEDLEWRLSQLRRAAVSRLQDAFRAHFALRVAACVRIQSLLRCWADWREFHTIRNGTIQVQTFWRHAVASRRLQRQKQAAVVVQCALRSCSARRLRRSLAAATTVQSLLRMLTARQSYREMRRASIQIQSVLRMVTQRAAFKQQLEARRHQQSLEGQLELLRMQLLDKERQLDHANQQLAKSKHNEKRLKEKIINIVPLLNRSQTAVSTTPIATATPQVVEQAIPQTDEVHDTESKPPQETAKRSNEDIRNEFIQKFTPQSQLLKLNEQMSKLKKENEKLKNAYRTAVTSTKNIKSKLMNDGWIKLGPDSKNKENQAVHINTRKKRLLVRKKQCLTPVKQRQSDLMKQLPGTPPTNPTAQLSGIGDSMLKGLSNVGSFLYSTLDIINDDFELPKKQTPETNRRKVFTEQTCSTLNRRASGRYRGHSKMNQTTNHI